MADSLETISAQLRIEYPFPQTVTEGGEVRDMTQEEYDQWITDQAAAIREQQLEAEAEAIEAEIRRLTRLAFTKLGENYDKLNSGVTIPASESRAMLADVTRATHFLIRILRHAGIIESA